MVDSELQILRQRRQEFALGIQVRLARDVEVLEMIPTPEDIQLYGIDDKHLKSINFGILKGDQLQDWQIASQIVTAIIHKRDLVEPTKHVNVGVLLDAITVLMDKTYSEAAYILVGGLMETLSIDRTIRADEIDTVCRLKW